MVRTVDYMGMTFPMLSENGKENLIDFNLVYQRTANKNKAVGVILRNGMVRLMKYRDDLDVRTLLMYKGCNDLLEFLEISFQPILEVKITKLIPCKLLAEKRTMDTIIEQFVFENDALTMDLEDAVYERVKCIMRDKYAGILHWYKYYTQRRIEKYMDR